MIRLFLSHNNDLGPPFRILVDTNFINFSIQNKIELVQGMMDCLMAKCEPQLSVSPPYQSSQTEIMRGGVEIGIPTITDCVLAELEKLGPKYRLALRSVTLPAAPSPLLGPQMFRTDGMMVTDKATSAG